MKIDEVELRRIRLPYRTPFKTSFADQREKHAVIVTVRSEGVEGYGEGTMDPFPFYREECIAGAWHLLREAFAPELIARGCAHPSELTPRWAHWRGNPMAKAALEMAVWDCYARQLGVPLRTLLGGGRTEIPVGASLGMNTIDKTVENVGVHVEQGYKRVKLKIEPGWDIEPVRVIRETFGDAVPLQVDANTAYTRDDGPLLAQLDRFGLILIEQPLPEDDVTGHAIIAKQVGTPICLDESIVSARAAIDAIERGACSIINVKAGRVGGYLEAITVHDVCRERGVPVWCGGMLETGIGRAMNLALAALPNFTITGDVSAAERFWKRDIVLDPVRLDNGYVSLRTGPGIGVELDHPFIESVTLSTQIIGASV